MRLVIASCVVAFAICSAGSTWGQEKKASQQSANNLKAIGKAMLEHTGFSLDPNAKPKLAPLPTHAIYSKDGKTPLLSWRVTILPYLGQESLCKEFKLDEPWDSGHNKKLITKMPKVYNCAAAPEEISKAGKTYYQVYVGAETAFPGNQKIFLATGITDGTSNTIMAVEAKEPVIWTKPEDLKFPKGKEKMPAVGGLFKTGFHALFCDGTVQFYRPDPPDALMRGLVTRAGGEDVNQSSLPLAKEE